NCSVHANAVSLGGYHAGSTAPVDREPWPSSGNDPSQARRTITEIALVGDSPTPRCSVVSLRGPTGSLPVTTAVSGARATLFNAPSSLRRRRSFALLCLVRARPNKRRRDRVWPLTKPGGPARRSPLSQ